MRAATGEQALSTQNSKQPRRIALFSSRFRDGGVERWITRLADGLTACGYDCDLIAGESGSAALKRTRGRVWVPKRNEHFGQLIRRYLVSEPPSIALPFRTADYTAVISGTRHHAPDTRIFLVTGAFISERLVANRARLIKAWKTRYRLYRQWSRANGVIAVSPEVGLDWLETGAFAIDAVHSPAPPVVGEDVLEASRMPLDHAWFKTNGPSVILGVGRLHRDKCFDRVINALPILRKRLDARLILLGDGDDKPRLEHRIKELGLSDVVDMPGFVTNPYNWMRSANAVVVPSRTETFGFVLIESMYLGTPFVADDNPPGPRSIRHATGQGTLTNTRDPNALARAIETALSQTKSHDTLHEAVSQYQVHTSVGHYLKVLGINQP